MTTINSADYTTLASYVAIMRDTDDIFEDICHFQKTSPEFRAMLSRCFSSDDECAEFVSKYAILKTELRLELNSHHYPVYITVDGCTRDGDLLIRALDELDLEQVDCIEEIERHGYETREHFVMPSYDEYVYSLTAN